MNTIEILTAIASTLGILLGTFFMIAKFVKPLFNRLTTLFNTWESFIRDWAGTPAEAGRDAVPGVMERLNRIDGELQHNGGSSMKDQLRRLETEILEASNVRKEVNEKIDLIYEILKQRS